MNTPGFSAEASLYQAHRHYQAGRHPVESIGQMIIPAIPACRNCDGILDRCRSNGWRPGAVCDACYLASKGYDGYCYEEGPDPVPPPGQPFPRF